MLYVKHPAHACGGHTGAVTVYIFPVTQVLFVSFQTFYLKINIYIYKIKNIYIFNHKDAFGSLNKFKTLWIPDSAD